MRAKIAIPCNDGINIFPEMLGRAKYMLIYEIKNGKEFRLIEKRNNPFAVTMQHLKTLDVYELINDCSIIISANIGKKGIKRLLEKGMELFIRKGDIQDALNDVIKKGEDNRVKELKRKIDDLKKRLPIHSIPPSMIQDLEDFEDEFKRINKK